MSSVEGAGLVSEGGGSLGGSLLWLGLDVEGGSSLAAPEAAQLARVAVVGRVQWHQLVRALHEQTRREPLRLHCWR